MGMTTDQSLSKFVNSIQTTSWKSEPLQSRTGQFTKPSKQDIYLNQALGLRN